MEIEKEIQKHADKEKAKILQGFFKTGPCQYGEGDVFLGLTSMQNQEIAKQFKELPPEKIQDLLNSKIHEHRMIALRILLIQFKKASPEIKKEIFEFYLKNTKNINNWDLVDISAPTIVGNYLLDKNRDILYELAHSLDLWEKRIAIVSTFTFIRQDDFEDTLQISEILLQDKHDLIHKAVGWMLREVGKRNEEILEEFLKKHYKKIPRTTIRYAIERFEEEKRKKYLRGEICGS